MLSAADASSVARRHNIRTAKFSAYRHPNRLRDLTRSEIDQQAYGPQFVTVENSMGVVHSSQGSLKPAHPKLYSEPAIVAWLAERVLGPETPVSWCWLIENYDRVRDLIE